MYFLPGLRHTVNTTQEGVPEVRREASCYSTLAGAVKIAVSQDYNSYDLGGNEKCYDG